MSQIPFMTISEAVEALQTGHVVAVPTETVYGLAASMESDLAIKQVFSLKNRPLNHPLIVHIAHPEQLDLLTQHRPEQLETLIQHFWPGPLTFVLPAKPHINPLITGGQTSVAVRMPAHPLMLNLIEKLGIPLVAPSANRFGRISPTTPMHVYDEFGAALPGIVDGGRCQIGVESTILDARNIKQAMILRAGMIGAEQMNEKLGWSWVQSPFHNPNQQDSNLRVSGHLDNHYAPSKTLILVDSQQQYDQLKQQNLGKIYLLSRTFHDASNPFSFQMPADPSAYAYQLYFQLRIADTADVPLIVLERPPLTVEWQAVNDRLEKARTKE